MFLGCSVNVHFHLFVPLSDSEDLNSWKTKNKTHNKLKWTTNDTAYYSILSSLEVWWSTNYPQDLPTCDSSSNKYYSVKKSIKIFGWSLSTTKIKSFQNGLSCQTHSLVIPDIDFFHTNLKPKHICPTALFERNKTEKIYTFTCSFLTLNSCCVLSPRALFNRSICLCRASFSSVNLFCVNYNTTFKGCL